MESFFLGNSCPKSLPFVVFVFLTRRCRLALPPLPHSRSFFLFFPPRFPSGRRRSLVRSKGGPCQYHSLCFFDLRYKLRPVYFSAALPTPWHPLLSERISRGDYERRCVDVTSFSTKKLPLYNGGLNGSSYSRVSPPRCSAPVRSFYFLVLP